MYKLNKKELQKINGGVSASMIGYIIRGITTIVDLGRNIGSAIRRIQTRNICR